MPRQLLLLLLLYTPTWVCFPVFFSDINNQQKISARSAYTMAYKVYGEQCTLYIIYTLYYISGGVQCTLYNVQCTWYSVDNSALV